ncbi:MAG: PQQ-binding-like beta-propeller repeat protein [Halobaculum sp.]
MRRRALLRAGSLAALTTLPGCTGVLDDGSAPGGGSTGTVNPQLRGTPTPGGAVDWAIELADVERLLPADDLVITQTPLEDSLLYRAFDVQNGGFQWRVEFPTEVFMFSREERLIVDIRSEPNGDSRRLAALDRDTGKRQWETETGVHWREFVGEAVIAEQSDPKEGGKLRAYDTVSGELLWSAPAPEKYIRQRSGQVVTLEERLELATGKTATPAETETSTPSGGATESEGAPVRIGLYDLLARTAATGETRWRVPLPTDTDALRSVGPFRGQMLLVDGTGNYWVIDAERGEFVTDGSLPVPVTAFDPAYVDGTVYFGEWAGFGDDESPSTLAAVDLADGTSWVTEFSTAQMRVVGVGEAVYANHLTDDGVVTVAHDPADGSERWRDDVTLIEVSEDGPLVGQDGDLVALTPSGSERWRRTLPFDGDIRAVFGPETETRAFTRWNRLIVLSSAGVASYDVSDGTVRTSVTGIGFAESGLATATDRTAVVGTDERVYGIPL